jgi:hypothetical protein
VTTVSVGTDKAADPTTRYDKKIEKYFVTSLARQAARPHAAQVRLRRSDG